ncbi:uncharacterized protein PV07_03106 [Cladophialophora immunda]|uniref:Glucose-methanol-choline oxidoreductase N-terminal domain-containing protein n=1 Tax=Cladophialophora immunda TaxID=569365 RepID=A0A0D2CJX6_9EURO|nr:uncharacterized protein PV07_03106 [Cladophialophora immunda]KIW31458.1 hypothetical protein PV07_03106 [Cladophialophora immunda]
MAAHRETFDFIVVGAGNSGAVIASKIAHSNAAPNVLLIEAGGDAQRPELYLPSQRYTSVHHYPDIRFDYQTTPQKHLDGRILTYYRGRGLGGSSLANYLGYIRGAASDYNTWASMVGDDAYKWDNVLERYKEIENLSFEDDNDENQWVKLVEGAHSTKGPLGLQLFPRKQWPRGNDILMQAAQDFGWPINPDQNSGHPIGLAAVTTTSYEGSRTTSATAYLSNLPPNLHIWTNTIAHRIILEDNPAEDVLRAAGVVLADGREVRAKAETILSLGSIDTPKILLLSGIGPKDELQELGIPCRVNLPRVGKDMLDHVFLPLRWGCSSALSDKMAYASNKPALLAARKEWLRSRTGSEAFRELANLVGFLKLDKKLYSQEELSKLPREVQQRINQPDAPQFEVFLAGDVPRVLERQNGEDAIGMCVMLMNPQSRGSVILSSNDPHAVPVIDGNFLAHPYDRATLVDGTRELLRFVNSAHLSKYIGGRYHAPKTDSKEDVLAFIRKELGSVLHPVATVKMGRADDPTACVDTNMCVRGVKNLRVVDLSVCPVLTNNHTQSTAYLVGQIGWKKVAEKYGLRDGRRDTLGRERL